MNPDSQNAFYEDTSPGVSLGDELEELQSKNAEKMELIEDVEHLFQGMLSADDTPDEEVHMEQFEEIYERLKEIEY